MLTKFQLENFLGSFMKNPKNQKYICMDERKSKNKVSTRKLEKKGKVRDFYQSQPLEMKQPVVKMGEKGVKKKNDSSSSGNSNNIVRVKVLMTKEEAAKLLGKRKKEGKIKLKDVVSELAKIPAQRVSVVPLTDTCSKEIALPSIFEEEEY